MSFYFILGIYILLGILGYGLNLAYFQREYPTIAYRNRKHDLIMAFFCLFLGPCGFFGTILFLVFQASSAPFKHGMMFWPTYQS